MNDSKEKTQTERDALVAITKRLEADGLIKDVDYPHEPSNELSYKTITWHDYWVRYRFDEAGNIIETGSGC